MLRCRRSLARPLVLLRRNLAGGPDDYFGPGGLSARQIFEKVQEGRQRDADAALAEREQQRQQLARQQAQQEEQAKKRRKRLEEQQATLEQQAQQRQQSPTSDSTHRSQNAAAPFQSEDELVKVSSKELRQRLLAKEVDVSDCFERSDLVERARLHLLCDYE